MDRFTRLLCFIRSHRPAALLPRRSRTNIRILSMNPTRNYFSKSLPLVGLLFCLLCVESSEAAVLITNGSSWKYFIGTQEASTPVNAWRQLGFADGSWQSGFAPIGYPSDPP